MKRCNKGISIVEVLIALGIFGIIFVFVFNTLTLFFNTEGLILENKQALHLAQEGQEFLHFIRDEDWTTLTDLTVGTTYYFEVATSTITTTNTTEVVQGKYTRSFKLYNGYRDSNNDFVASTTPGAVSDIGTLIAVTRVTWGVDKEVRIHTLITNLHNI